MSGYYGGNQPPDGYREAGSDPGYPAATGYGPPGYPGPGTYPYYPQPQGPYKGSQYGLPWKGPGSLGSQWLRLVARLLDGACLSPFSIIFRLVAPQPLTTTYTYDTSGIQQPHFHLHAGALWIYLVFSVVIGMVIWPLYEGLLTHYAGRTIGKMALGLRIVHLSDPHVPITGGQAAKRVFVFEGLGVIPVIGWIWALVDGISCLPDQGRQCLHDKISKTLVISER